MAPAAAAGSLETPSEARPVVALVGNPNSGKTTLFNALTGASARVGNYPGITVDHREGVLNLGATAVRVVDLPGTYSLVPRAEDEVVAIQALLGRLPGVPRPALVVAVVDATNLERNLYLVEQLLELGGTIIVALTMMDTVRADGVTIDDTLLAQRLGVPVIPVSSVARTGLAELQTAIRDRLGAPDATTPPSPVPIGTSAEIDSIGRLVAAEWKLDSPPAALGWWILSAREAGVTEHLALGAKVAETLLRMPPGGPLIEGLVSARYARVGEWLAGVRTQPEARRKTRSTELTDRVDAIALHRVLGPILLVVVFGGLFQALFTWAKPVMDGIDDGMRWLGGQVGEVMPASFPLLRSLVVDGVIRGVGSVVVFVPQIAVLFFCLGLLEDSGYLARAAFLLDRLMARVGLHGRAFVPMLSGFACAVPAIMATRTIESRKDRLVTILVTPLMSCSARLPVYGLMIATVFATTPPVFGVFQVGALVMISMYALSVAAALTMAFIFKRTLLRSPTPAFVLELPPYRLPRLAELVRLVTSKVRSFLVDAGTIILAITLVLWGLFHFPRSAELEAKHDANLAAISAGSAADRSTLQADEEAAAAQDRLRYSLAGRMGHFIEPAIKPLGWDWKVGVGIIASFAARETLVATLGLVYGLGEGADEHSSSLREAMQKDRDPETGRPVHTPLSGLSLMVFFVLAMQCMSTLAAVRRETGSWKWPAFQFAYMTVLATSAAFIVFQGGRLLGLG